MPWRAGPLIALWLCALLSAVPVSAASVEHAVIGPDGVLRGQVQDVSGSIDSAKVAGLQVRLARGQQVIASTTTDSRGKFALQNLRAGPYTVMVNGSGASSWQGCQVWTARTAPPQVGRELHVPLSGLVRGQPLSPFPIMSLRQAAVVGGIAGGAIAAPVIFHNTVIDNRGPASP